MFLKIYNVFLILTMIYALYFGLTALTIFIRKKEHKILNSKVNHFAILIAARNEEHVIANLIDSLKKQNYPKEAYEIDVIINNCTDNTLNIVQKSEAKAIICQEKITSKGEALKYAFSLLNKRKDLDAYIIFDADNIVDANFLKEMNIIINQGYNVAEGLRESKNITDNWLSGSYSIFYYFQNLFFNQARYNVNLSASINGTGFMVKKDLIDQKGFNVKTLTEDVEFTAICALNKEKIAFAKKAITYDEQPINFNESWKQRKRWTKGNLQCLRYYFKPLIKDFFKTGNLSSLDMALIYMAPIMQLISFILFTAWTVYKIMYLPSYHLKTYFYTLGIDSLILTYLISVLVNCLIIKYNNHKIKDSISAILLFNVFIITWIPINLICLFKKNISWEAINHTRSIKINSANKQTKKA